MYAGTDAPCWMLTTHASRCSKLATCICNSQHCVCCVCVCVCVCMCRSPVTSPSHASITATSLSALAIRPARRDTWNVTLARTSDSATTQAHTHRHTNVLHVPVPAYPFRIQAWAAGLAEVPFTRIACVYVCVCVRMSSVPPPKMCDMCCGTPRPLPSLLAGSLYRDMTMSENCDMTHTHTHTCNCSTFMLSAMPRACAFLVRGCTANSK